jgi:predicted N-formylglutamate amidohydrolase
MTSYLVTCEHASNKIPKEYARPFSSGEAKKLLTTHAGYDIGAAHVATCLAPQLNAPLFLGGMSRLLIDLNRSLHHPRVFSTRSASLSAKLREQLVVSYEEYRAEVLDALEQRKPCVFHLSIHSFTPIWEGVPRSTDIGLLYDPKREGETAWAKRVQRRLREQSGLTIHRNAPYRGYADGFTTALRAKFSQRRYLGVEIEVNQKLIATKADQERMAQLLLSSFDPL